MYQATAEIDYPERLPGGFHTAERRPVAEAVLSNTLAQAAIMRPDPQSSAMRDIVATLMEKESETAHLPQMHA